MLASLNVHREAFKTVVAEGVEAGQCSGVSVALQTDRTSQLLLQFLESLAGGGGFFCHHNHELGYRSTYHDVARRKNARIRGGVAEIVLGLKSNRPSKNVFMRQFSLAASTDNKGC